MAKKTSNIRLFKNNVSAKHKPLGEGPLAVKFLHSLVSIL